MPLSAVLISPVDVMEMSGNIKFILNVDPFCKFLALPWTSRLRWAWMRSLPLPA